MTKQEIRKIAILCKLEISDAEAQKLSSMFSDTLDKMKILEELDTSKVAGTYHVTGSSNVYREQGIGNSLSGDDALKNAGEVIRGYFATRGVFDRSL